MAIIEIDKTKKKVELYSSEIDEIIDNLERTPHNIFEFLNYKKLIKKLKAGKKIK